MGINAWIGRAGIDKARCLLGVGPVSVVVEGVFIKEQAAGGAQALIGRCRDAELMGRTGVLVLDPIALVWRVAGLTNVAVIGSGIVDAAIALIIGQIEADIGVGRIVRLLDSGVVQIGSGIDHIQHAQTAIHRQGRCIKLVAQGVRIELGDLQVAHAGLIAEYAIGLEVLTHMHQVH